MKCHGYSAWVWLNQHDPKQKVAEIGRAFPCVSYQDAIAQHEVFRQKGPPQSLPFGRWVEVFKFYRA
jgi:hypothetical protein